MQRARWLYVTVPILAAMAFATSVWVAPWWTIGEVTVGPFGSHHCFGGNCRAGGLAWTGGTDLWMRSAIATGAAALLSMILLLAVAGGIAARRTPVLVSKMSLVSIACAIACAAYFVVELPREMPLVLGSGAIAFGLGVVMGLAVPIAVLRRHRRA
jgi:hypothetical protein